MSSQILSWSTSGSDGSLGMSSGISTQSTADTPSSNIDNYHGTDFNRDVSSEDRLSTAARPLLAVPATLSLTIATDVWFLHVQPADVLLSFPPFITHMPTRRLPSTTPPRSRCGT